MMTCIICADQADHTDHITGQTCMQDLDHTDSLYLVKHVQITQIMQIPPDEHVQITQIMQIDLTCGETCMYIRSTVDHTDPTRANVCVRSRSYRSHPGKRVRNI